MIHISKCKCFDIMTLQDIINNLMYGSTHRFSENVTTANVD